MDAIRQDVVDALVWLDLGQARSLLHVLVKGRPETWQPAVDRLVPDLRGEANLSDPRWREALLDELERRVAGDDDDAADMETMEVPNLARFAADVRSSREAAQLGAPATSDDGSDELADDAPTDERPG